MNTTTNRILNGIDKYKAIIKEKNISDGKLETLSRNLDMELVEYCRFQELKSAAVGTQLTLDEAQTIYDFLGNVPDHFNRQPVEVKAVLTNVFFSLIKSHIKQKTQPV